MSTDDFLPKQIVPAGPIELVGTPGDEWQRLFAGQGRAAMEEALKRLDKEHERACEGLEVAPRGRVPIYDTITDFLERGIERARERLEELKP